MKHYIFSLLLVFPFLFCTGQTTFSLANNQTGINHLYFNVPDDMGAGVAFFKFNNDHYQDLIFAGGDGDDMIVSGTGADKLYGQGGNDVFFFGKSVYDTLTLDQYPVRSDIIEGFEEGDTIDLSYLLELSGFTGTDPFAEGYITIEDGATEDYLHFDADGTGGSEVQGTIATVRGADLEIDNLTLSHTVEHTM